MVKGTLTDVVLMRKPLWEVGHEWKKILNVQAVNFSFPSAASTQNKVNNTSEDVLTQDPEETLRILYYKKTRSLGKGKKVWLESNRRR